MFRFVSYVQRHLGQTDMVKKIPRESDGWTCRMRRNLIDKEGFDGAERRVCEVKGASCVKDYRRKRKEGDREKESMELFKNGGWSSSFLCHGPLWKSGEDLKMLC